MPGIVYSSPGHLFLLSPFFDFFYVWLYSGAPWSFTAWFHLPFIFGLVCPQNFPDPSSRIAANLPAQQVRSADGGLCPLQQLTPTAAPGCTLIAPGSSSKSSHKYPDSFPRRSRRSQSRAIHCCTNFCICGCAQPLQIPTNISLYLQLGASMNSPYLCPLHMECEISRDLRVVLETVEEICRRLRHRRTALVRGVWKMGLQSGPVGDRSPDGLVTWYQPGT